MGARRNRRTAFHSGGKNRTWPRNARSACGLPERFSHTRSYRIRPSRDRRFADCSVGNSRCQLDHAKSRMRELRVSQGVGNDPISRHGRCGIARITHHRAGSNQRTVEPGRVGANGGMAAQCDSSALLPLSRGHESFESLVKIPRHFLRDARGLARDPAHTGGSCFARNVAAS
jgi:hypothetical protein